MKTIALIVPVYNEADAIPLFLAAASAALRPLEQRGYAIEFVFVNDGSTDDTLDRLRAAVAADPRVRAIDLSRNFGKEAALSAGLDETDVDAVIPIDVDLQEPPEVIPRLVEKWEEGFDTVLAHKADRSTDTFLKRQSARWFYRIHNMIAEPAIPEDVGDFRLLDRRVVEEIRRLPEQRRFMKGLFAWIGFRTATVEYERAPRSAGRTRFTPWRLWNFALDGITSFSIAPLRLWIYFGTLTAGFAFVYMVYTILRALIHGIDTPGYASLLATVLFLGGIQLIGIGVIGEYMGRTYIESKRRPSYVVRDRLGGDAREAARPVPLHAADKASARPAE